MPEVVIKDKSISEPPVAELHPLRTTPQGTQQDGVEVGHEHRDIDARAIAKWFAILAGIVLFTYLAMGATFAFVVSVQSRQDRLPSPLATARQVPPAPYVEGLTLGGDVRAGTHSHLLRTRAQEGKTLKEWGLNNTTQIRTGRRTNPIPDNIVREVAREGAPASAAGNATEDLDEERTVPSNPTGGLQ